MQNVYKMPVHADEEMMIWIYRIPSFLVLAFSVLMGIWTGYAIVTVPFGFAAATLMEKFSKKKKAGFVQHKIYAMGLAEPRNGTRLFPPSFAKVFTS